jgi:hypothetical protein
MQCGRHLIFARAFFSSFVMLYPALMVGRDDGQQVKQLIVIVLARSKHTWSAYVPPT